VCTIIYFCTNHNLWDVSDAIEQAHQAAAHKFQQEHAKLIAGYEKLDKELQDTKQKLAQERYGTHFFFCF